MFLTRFKTYPVGLFFLLAVFWLTGAKKTAADTTLPENHATPAFTLKDAGGAKHSLADYKGRSFVVYFACGCKWCHEFGREWAQMQRSGVLTDAITPTDANAPLSAGEEKPPWTLLVFMGDAAAAKAYAAEVGLDLKQTVLLPDPNLKVTQTYHAMPCPRLYVLDKNGLLRYVNSHVDDAPQKAAANVLAAKTVDGLRRSILPPKHPVKNSSGKPAPKPGKGVKHGKI